MKSPATTVGLDVPKNFVLALEPMVSVIIPVLDEERWLPACLDAVLPQVREMGSEILVVDGGSSDSTRSVARQGRVRLITSARGRGLQMNTGAAQARGSLLVFLPADTRLPPGSLELLLDLDRTGSPQAGGFHQRFDHPRRLLRAVSALHNLRAVVSGVIYGDQVLFIRREIFMELGGFREDMNMEDVEFGSRLRRRVRPRLLNLVATTSARRFDRAGDLRATAEAVRILVSWTFLRRVPRSRTFFSPVR